MTPDHASLEPDLGLWYQQPATTFCGLHFAVRLRVHPRTKCAISTSPPPLCVSRTGARCTVRGLAFMRVAAKRGGEVRVEAADARGTGAFNTRAGDAYEPAPRTTNH